MADLILDTKGSPKNQTQDLASVFRHKFLKMPANARVSLSLPSQRRQTRNQMTTPKVALITGITGQDGS